VQGAPLEHASQSGYCRAARGKLLLIGDFGKPPPLAFSRAAHAGCLSFELSSGADPVIVNCGAPMPGDADWMLPSRSTAAHSTATVCDSSSSQIVPSASDETVAQARLSGPGTVDCQVLEENGEFEMRGAHDGYAGRFGIVHARRLRLAASGERLRGEDRLMARSGLKGPAVENHGAFAIRFHLHPSVRAQLSQDGRTAHLVTPHREGWRIASDGLPLSIEESVFLADIKGPRRSLQVVIAGTIEDGREARVGWVLEKSVASVVAETVPKEEAVSALDELPLD